MTVGWGSSIRALLMEFPATGFDWRLPIHPDGNAHGSPDPGVELLIDLLRLHTTQIGLL